MAGDSTLFDVVLFELPSYLLAEALETRLGAEWNAWLEPRRVGWTIGVELRPDEGDLAVLLDAVVRWATDLRLPAVLFELDGRSYVLSPRRRDEARRRLRQL